MVSHDKIQQSAQNTNATATNQKLNALDRDRFAVDKRVNKNQWKCLNCVKGSDITPEFQSTLYGMQEADRPSYTAEDDLYVLPTPNKCNTCRGKVKKDFFKCNTRRKQFTSKRNAARCQYTAQIT